MRYKFTKMEGLGNDFVVFDHRDSCARLTKEQIVHIANRHQGIGCDQVVIITADDDKYIRVQFFNADGSESGMCGNALRCIGALLLDNGDSTEVSLADRRVRIRRDGELVSVNMGKPSFEPEAMGLTEPQPMESLEVEGQTGHGVFIGNPHMVIQAKGVDDIDIAMLGSKIEHAPIFAHRTNVEWIDVIDRAHIRMRVWERGSGITKACGSGACAAAVVAYRQNLVDEEVQVILDGGVLDIRIEPDQQIWMTGPAQNIFTGEIVLS